MGDTHKQSLRAAVPFSSETVSEYVANKDEFAAWLAIKDVYADIIKAVIDFAPQNHQTPLLRLSSASLESLKHPDVLYKLLYQKKLQDIANSGVGAEPGMWFQKAWERTETYTDLHKKYTMQNNLLGVSYGIGEHGLIGVTMEKYPRQGYSLACESVNTHELEELFHKDSNGVAGKPSNNVFFNQKFSGVVGTCSMSISQEAFDAGTKVVSFQASRLRDVMSIARGRDMNSMSPVDYALYNRAHSLLPSLADAYFLQQRSGGDGYIVQAILHLEMPFALHKGNASVQQSGPNAAMLFINPSPELWKSQQSQPLVIKKELIDNSIGVSNNTDEYDYNISIDKYSSLSDAYTVRILQKNIAPMQKTTE